MEPVSDPLEAWQRFLQETRGHIEVTTWRLAEWSLPNLELEALSEGEGLEDLGGDCGCQHEDLVDVNATVSLPPLGEHPPAQQRSHLITCKHLPATPGPKDTHTRPILFYNDLSCIHQFPIPAAS